MAIAAHRAPIVGWRICSQAEGKVTTEIAFKEEGCLQQQMHVLTQTPVSPWSQETAGGADGPRAQSSKRKVQKHPGPERGVEDRGNKSAAE